MVRPHCIDLLDIVTERRCFIYDELQKIMRCGFSG